MMKLIISLTFLLVFSGCSPQKRTYSVFCDNGFKVVGMTYIFLENGEVVWWAKDGLKNLYKVPPGTSCRFERDRD